MSNSCLSGIWIAPKEGMMRRTQRRALLDLAIPQDSIFLQGTEFLTPRPSHLDSKSHQDTPQSILLSPVQLSQYDPRHTAHDGQTKNLQCKNTLHHNALCIGLRIAPLSSQNGRQDSPRMRPLVEAHHRLIFYTFLHYKTRTCSSMQMRIFQPHTQYSHRSQMEPFPLQVGKIYI